MSVAVSFYESCSKQLIPGFTMAEQVLVMNLMIPPQTIADDMIRNGKASNPSITLTSSQQVDLTSSNGWFDICLAPFTKYGVSPGQAQALATSALKQSQGDMTSHVSDLVYTGKYLQGDIQFVAPLIDMMSAVTTYGQSVLQIAIPNQQLLSTAMQQYTSLAGYAVTEMWLSNFSDMLESLNATPPSYQTVIDVCKLLLLMLRYDMTRFFVGASANVDNSLVTQVHAMALYDNDISDAITRSLLLVNTSAQKDASRETEQTTYTNLQNIDDSLEHTSQYWVQNRTTAQNSTRLRYIIIALTWIASLAFIVHSSTMHGTGNVFVAACFAVALIVLLGREAYVLFTEP